jgi:hypothetical protein
MESSEYSDTLIKVALRQVKFMLLSEDVCQIRIHVRNFLIPIQSRQDFLRLE